ncbi:MAG: 4-hydroxy-3-methylbut-2-enyl diphosphate reductase [Planctomycetota bacterium]|nr:MAG: 4-hydroxy-3-methylbut-2-enyl diphosphate reductase [Planctomycetota bacterium]
MEVTLAKALGTCFGVQDAIDEAMSPEFKNSLTIVGQLVHNPQVVEKLKNNGVLLINGIEDIDKIKTKNVMITAHGAADVVKNKLKERGFTVFDASCPLVIRVHKAIKRMVLDGYFPVVIGRGKHVEVKGIVGDLDEFYTIEDEEDIQGLVNLNKSKIGIVSQTTNQTEKTISLIDKIKLACKDADVLFKNTICKPTRDRQIAVDEITDVTDILIVVGGKNSSNTKKLKSVGDHKKVPSYHIESFKEINPDWFINKTHCGITAGTSTPHEVIQKVFDKIKEISSLISQK